MSIPFELLNVQESEDGRIFCEWKTVADDGGLLIEGGYFKPEPSESVEECVDRCLAELKERREIINATPPKRSRPAPPAKQALKAARLARIKAKHQDRVNDLPAEDAIL